MIRIVTLNTNRSEYDIRDAAACSITVGELINELERNYNDGDKIVFSNDNGYTYGYVTEDCIAEHNVETREEEEAREKAEEYADNMKKQYRVWKFVLGCSPELTAEMEIVEAESADEAEDMVSDIADGWGIIGSEEITEENMDWNNDFHRIFNK